ncbi:CehA/McbA family metallohydrolase [Streptococcus sp. VEG1o]|uniref:CehA/McbA family metallohydrolase n=1 Tax=Streptococcus sp. VEG1o TaxID=3097368 RepID=UPI00397E16F3
MTQTYHFQLNSKNIPVCQNHFAMPPQCQGITLHHDLKYPYTMLVLLMIKDSRGKIRFQKQLSYSQPCISLSTRPERTTIGGVPGTMPTGSWTIEAIYNQEYGKYFDQEPLAFNIQLDFGDSDVAEAINGPSWVNEDFEYVYFDMKKIYQKGKKWYRGDFHTHTQLSDGKELIGSVTAKVLEEGLDFYVATEHNLLHTGWEKTELFVMPGIEMTTNFGHANVFGLTKRPENLDAIILEKEKQNVLFAMDTFIKECQDNGWLFSINHPYLYEWKWLFGDLEWHRVNCLEIINDPTYELEPHAEGRKANQQAVALADLLWSEGYQICAIGGSDSHMLKGECYATAKTPSVPGDPSTWLLMEHLSVENLLTALQDCHAYVTRFCKLEARFTTDDGQEFLFGDTLPKDAEYLLFDLSLTIAEEPILFYLYNGKKVELELEQVGKNLYHVSGQIPLQADFYQWIRFGANTKVGDDFRFYGNAITKGKKEPQIRTFAQASQQLGINI